MDVDTVDREYAQLEEEAQQTGQAIQQLASKMQAANEAGDDRAREWILDLKSIALQIQQEQLQVQSLLQALHGFAANALQQPPQYAAAAPMPYAAPAAPMPAAAPAAPQGGGMLSRFMGGNFGQAMTQGVGMGAGFGLADAAINAIFGN